MDSNITIGIRDDGVHYQVFNNKRYYLYKGERYFSSSSKRLHIQVYKNKYGDVPKGFHVHHKDGNRANNDISNLELITAKEHLSQHSKKRVKDNPSFFIKFQAMGQNTAKIWHSSTEGLAWHKKHGKNSWKNRKYKTHQCLQCGKYFESRYSGIIKYCHNNCKAKALRERRKLERGSI